MRTRTPVTIKHLETWSVYGTKQTSDNSRIGFCNSMIQAYDADEAEAIYNGNELGYTAEIVKQISCFPYVTCKVIPQK